jgi:hypothetical protein
MVQYGEIEYVLLLPTSRLCPVIQTTVQRHERDTGMVLRRKDTCKGIANSLPMSLDQLLEKASAGLSIRASVRRAL